MGLMSGSTRMEELCVLELRVKYVRKLLGQDVANI